MADALTLFELLRTLADRPGSEAARAACSDLRQRLHAGDNVSAELYLDFLPRIAADPDLALLLIREEMRSHQEPGSLAKYQARYPAIADQLAALAESAPKADAETNASELSDPLQTTDDLAPHPTPDDQSVARLGEYQLNGEIGRGGMGLVLAAHDPSLDREVAIKMLIPGRSDVAPASRRFLRECQITARLPHPGVPPVHAVGHLPDGTPYLVMKLIRGQTLARMLQDRSDLQTGLSELLRVFEQVCQAMGFAHAQGVIHRDLKPGNIMVGAFGEVQVMDWGLARLIRGVSPPSDMPDSAGPLVSEESETAFGAVMGTPAYMAPEQARGEVVDERADVFALGAILGEILTGQPAFTGSGAAARVQKAAAADLTDAFARLDGCSAPADLVELTRRCLSPQPHDRPANAGAVADAVLAHRAAMETKLRTAEREAAAAEARAIEARKRGRLRLALTGAISVLLIFCGAFAWWQDRQTTQRQIREQRVTDGIEQALARLPELRRQALWQPADDTLTQAEQLLAPDSAPELRSRLTTARRELALARRLDTVRIQRVQVSTGKMKAAQYRAAYRAVFQDHGFDILGADPSDLGARIAGSDLRDDLLAALDDWAHWEPDPIVSERVFAVARKVAGPSWRDSTDRKNQTPEQLQAYLTKIPPAQRTPTLVRVVAEAISKKGGRGEILLQEELLRSPSDFWLLYDLALLYEMRNELRLAAEAWRAARATRPSAWLVINELGAVLSELGELNAAEACFREAIRLEPNSMSYTNLGHTHYRRENFPAAIAAHREAIRLGPGIANAYTSLGTALRSSGKIDEALEAFRTARRLDPTDSAPRFNLGLALLTARNDPASALVEFREILHRKLDVPPAELLQLYQAMARALEVQGKEAEALAVWQQAVKNAPTDPELRYLLADTLCKVGKAEKAIPEYREAIRLNPRVPKYHSDLGVELRQKGNLDEAVACQREAIRLDAKFTQAHLNLGSAYLYQKKYEAACESYQAAIRLDPKLAIAHYTLGLALRQLKKWDEAKTALREAARLDPDRLAAVSRRLIAEIEAEEDKDSADGDPHARCQLAGWAIAGHSWPIKCPRNGPQRSAGGWCSSDWPAPGSLRRLAGL